MARNTRLMTALVLAALTGAAHAAITVGPGGGYDFDTIQAAISWALPGEAVDVYPGSYPENVILDKDLTLRGMMDAAGNRPQINPSIGRAVTANQGTTFEFSGFIVSNAQGGIYATGAREVTASIHDNIFHSLDSRGGFHWGDDTAGGEAVYLGGDVKVFNNLMYNNTGTVGASNSCTVRLRSDWGHHEFYNNTLVNNTNHRATIHLGGPYMQLYNNIIAKENQGAGIIQWDPYGGWAPDIQYNIIYECAGGASDASVTLSRTLIDDPMFMSEATNDFHLSLASPGIDAGMDMDLLHDLDGNMRPFDVPGIGDAAIYDIGAYEVPEPTTVCLLGLAAASLIRRRRR